MLWGSGQSSSTAGAPVRLWRAMRMRSPRSSIVSSGITGGAGREGVLERWLRRCWWRTPGYSRVISSRAEAIMRSSNDGARRATGVVVIGRVGEGSGQREGRSGINTRGENGLVSFYRRSAGRAHGFAKKYGSMKFRTSLGEISSRESSPEKETNLDRVRTANVRWLDDLTDLKDH